MKSAFVAFGSAVLGGVLSVSVTGQAQPTKTPSAVAFVSSTRVFTESVHGRAEAARLQTLQQQRTADLRSKQQALEATRQQILTATDAATRSPLQQKENQQRLELERGMQQTQVDYQNLQREINSDMQRRVRLVLDEVMKTQSYQLVLNSDVSLLWSAPELDLTSVVVGRLNGQ